MSYDDDDPQAFLKHLKEVPTVWPDELEIEGEGETDDVLPPIPGASKPPVKEESLKKTKSGKTGGTSTSTSTKGKGKGKKRKKRRMRINANLTNCKYNVVHANAKQMSWKSVSDDEPWDIWWTDVSVAAERLARMNRLQKINHFPCMAEICRKDKLAMNMNRMRRQFEKAYNFIPQAWVLPGDYDDLVAYAKKNRGRTYIAKPDAGCQGKGIYLTKTVSDIDPGENVVVQQYMAKPLLVDGLKFDLRIYALVISLDPLRVYLYKDGLARFCTEPYKAPTGDNVEESRMHLSNYAINKHSEKFTAAEDAKANTGHKRSIIAVFDALQKEGYDTERIWSRIGDVIIKTLIAVQPLLAHVYKLCQPEDNDGSSCFEILGFDILLDKKAKPYLVEVNHSPSFNTDTPLDKEIKAGLIHDTVRMVSIDVADKRKFILEERAKLKQRLYAKTKKSKEEKNIDIAAKAAARKTKLASRLQHELNNAGGFSLIYPVPERVERFQKFFVPFAPAADRKKKVVDDGKPKSAFGGSIPKRPDSTAKKNANREGTPALKRNSSTGSVTSTNGGTSARKPSSASTAGNTGRASSRAGSGTARRSGTAATAVADSRARSPYAQVPSRLSQSTTPTRGARPSSSSRFARTADAEGGKETSTTDTNNGHDISMCEDVYCAQCAEAGLALAPGGPSDLALNGASTGTSKTRPNRGQRASVRQDLPTGSSDVGHPKNGHQRDESIRRMIRRASTGNVLSGQRDDGPPPSDPPLAPVATTTSTNSYGLASPGRGSQRSSTSRYGSNGASGTSPLSARGSSSHRTGSTSYEPRFAPGGVRRISSRSRGARDYARDPSTEMEVYDRHHSDALSRYRLDENTYDDIPTTSSLVNAGDSSEWRLDSNNSEDYNDLFRQRPKSRTNRSDASTRSANPSEKSDYGSSGYILPRRTTSTMGGQDYDDRGADRARGGKTLSTSSSSNRVSMYGRAIQNDRPPIGDLQFGTSFPYNKKHARLSSTPVGSGSGSDIGSPEKGGNGPHHHRNGGSSVSIPSSTQSLGGSGLVISSLVLQSQNNRRQGSTGSGGRGVKVQSVSFPKFMYSTGAGDNRGADKAAPTWKRGRTKTGN